MGERHMNRIAQVIEPVEIIAGPFFAQQHIDDATGVKIRVAGKRRSRAITKKHEYEPEILFGRIAANLIFDLERLILAGLLDALPDDSYFQP